MTSSLSNIYEKKTEFDEEDNPLCHNMRWEKPLPAWSFFVP